MNIKYGEHNHKTVYYDNKPVESDSYSVRDQVTTDSEELALFIKFQQEHRNRRGFIFERKITEKGARYVIKTWVD